MSNYSVKLISITPDAEKTMMFCARVSNPNGQDSQNTKLLDYCIKHKHWSIFEQAYMTIEIQTSRAISAQILRHKSFNFQEFSARYSEVNEVCLYEARRQDIKNRQNSIDDMNDTDKTWFESAQLQLSNQALSLYKEALAKGIAKEQARMLLPMASKTKLYMSGSIRSWIHYLELRSHKDTQLEHREIAIAIKSILKDQLPNVYEATGWE